MEFDNLASRVHAAVSAVCPIVGVSIGRKADRATWRVDFDPAATPGQQAAARTVIDAFDPTPPPPPDLSDVDNLDKFVKALVLCIAQVGGLTVPQAKQLFTTKYRSLP